MKSKILTLLFVLMPISAMAKPICTVEYSPNCYQEPPEGDSSSIAEKSCENSDLSWEISSDDESRGSFRTKAKAIRAAKHLEKRGECIYLPQADDQTS